MLKDKYIKVSSFENTQEQMSLNIFSLSFNNNKHLEQKYREDFSNRSIITNRLAIIFGIIAFSIFGILDAYLVPDLKYFFWFLRFAVFAPFALSLLILSFFLWYQKVFQAIFLILEIIGGLIIVIMIVSSPPPVNYSYYAGLILIFMMVYTVSGMRFIWAVFGSFLIVLFYEIAAIVFGDTPPSILVNNNFFFIGANFIGMIASYEIERSDRRSFFLKYLLTKEKEKVCETNTVLEDRVSERTANLKNEIIVRTKAEEKLEIMLEEKEVLLKELYHRTKNNMQLISSMISLESSHIENPELQEVFLKTELKIQAMAMVHEELYKSRDLSKVNFKNYIENIVPLMIDTYSDNRTNITLNLELEDIFIMMDSAIPSGLILSELIVNIIKHAFKGKDYGNVFLKLSLLDSGEIELFLSDDGVGVKNNFDFRNQKSLGLETVYALGEHQLNGKIKMTGDGGISFSLKFKDGLYTQRV